MRPALLIALAMSALFLGGAVSDLAALVAERVEYPVYFKTRSVLGGNPPLSPKLKIASFDDTSVLRTERPELREKDLYLAIRAIAAKKPRVIMVLSGYGMPVSRYTASYYAEKITSIDVPIVFAAVGSEDEDGSTGPLGERPVDFALFHWADASVAACPHPAIRYQSVYGPNRSFLEGHPTLRLGLTNIPVANHFAPLFAGPDGNILPNAALYGARQRRCEAGRLILDGAPVPLDAAGTTLTNYLEPDRLGKTHSFYYGVLARAEDGYPAYFVDPDDVVVLVMDVAGVTSYEDTPVGHLPDYMLSLMHLNSVLTGKWLRRVEDHGLLAAGAGLAGAATIFLPGATAIVAALVGSAMIVLVALACFVYLGVVIPVALPAAAFLATGVVLFAYRAWRRDREVLQLRIAEAERDLLQAEMRDAAVIARALLPAEPPVSTLFAVEVYHRSIRHASGDWFAFEQSPDGRFLHVVLCDITGHGVQGAIIAATCKATLTALVRGEPGLRASPSFLVAYAERLNASLLEQGQGMHLLSMAAACFDWSRAVVHVFLAGHPLPLIVNEHGELLTEPAIPRHTLLGVGPQVGARLTMLPFAPGSQLIAFTDGMPLPSSPRQRLRRLGTDWTRTIVNPVQLYDAAWREETRRSGRRPDDDVGIIWVRHRQASLAQKIQNS